MLNVTVRIRPQQLVSKIFKKKSENIKNHFPENCSRPRKVEFT